MHDVERQFLHDPLGHDEAKSLSQRFDGITEWIVIGDEE